MTYLFKMKMADGQEFLIENKSPSVTDMVNELLAYPQFFPLVVYNKTIFINKNQIVTVTSVN